MSVSKVNRAESKFYLVGGGIASLATAAFLIRDGDVPGRNITVIEESDRLGGSLDGSGTPEAGYVIRGGRMLESKYQCTYDLFDSIPTLDGSRTVTQEIQQLNEVIKTHSTARLVRDGRAVDAPEFELHERHILTLERLALEPEFLLGDSSIDDHFDGAFFDTNFWLMWATTFAFQPWHSAVEFKRYLLRFAHMVDGFNKLRGIMRTPYNQYDSLVRPIHKWLNEHGVQFELGTRVVNLATLTSGETQRVVGIQADRGGDVTVMKLASTDAVIVTLGSMTEGSSLGSMDAPAELHGKRDGGAWTLWDTIARGRPEFGWPATFDSQVDESKWLSFTTTFHDPTFFEYVRGFTGNIPGEGGLVTFADSPWLFSIVLPHQPHFLGQPPGVQVCWGYGLRVDRRGHFVDKTMQQCCGREIMSEVCGYLGMGAATERVLQTCICIPSMMPFITSQFLRRRAGDRPEVQPKGWDNLAFTGQFCELPDDVVFTVEYSIRSARQAVYSLLGLNRSVPGVYKGYRDPRVLFAAFRSLHDMNLV